jgi:hypothetical protein
VVKREAPSEAAASSCSKCSDSSTGCTVRTVKGRPTNSSATTMPAGAYAILMPAARGLAEPAVAGVERGERDAGHGGRQGEGQVDQRVGQRAPGKR